MLNYEECKYLLELLAEDTIVEPTQQFPFTIKRRSNGYKDGIASKLQGKLSIMAECAGRKG